MMKKTLLYLAVLTAAFSVAAFAETMSFRGKITSVNPDQKELTISPTERSAGLPAEVNLSVKDQKSLKGIASLDELAVGDEILVEANKPAFGNKWDVKTLQQAGAAAAGGMQAGTTGTAGSRAGERSAY